MMNVSHMENGICFNLAKRHLWLVFPPPYVLPWTFPHFQTFNKSMNASVLIQTWDMETVSQKAHMRICKAAASSRALISSASLLIQIPRGTWNLLPVLYDPLWHETCPYQYWLTSPVSLEWLTQLFNIYKSALKTAAWSAGKPTAGEPWYQIQEMHQKRLCPLLRGLHQI